MRYKVEFTKDVLKKLKKMDNYTRTLIYNWIEKNIDNCENPYLYGKELTGEFKGKWRYRVGDYRIIAEIQNDKMIVLLVNIGHRRNIYVVHEDYQEYSLI